MRERYVRVECSTDVEPSEEGAVVPSDEGAVVSDEGAVVSE
jgi:hypothetical protein